MSFRNEWISQRGHNDQKCLKIPDNVLFWTGSEKDPFQHWIWQLRIWSANFTCFVFRAIYSDHTYIRKRKLIAHNCMVIDLRLLHFSAQVKGH
jgi:hypothetical protein